MGNPWRGSSLCSPNSLFSPAGDELPRKFLARTKNGQRYYLYADPDYCQCVFLGNELAMKNYNQLVSPPPLAPTVIGSGDLPPTVTQQMIDEVDPGLAIEDGDILDY